MKIVVSMIGCVQVSEDSYQTRVRTVIFDDTATLREIMTTFKGVDISLLNLSLAEEPKE